MVCFRLKHTWKTNLKQTKYNKAALLAKPLPVNDILEHIISYFILYGTRIVAPFYCLPAYVLTSMIYLTNEDTDSITYTSYSSYCHESRHAYITT
jgi:hypothetical protein